MSLTVKELLRLLQGVDENLPVMVTAMNHRHDAYRAGVETIPHRIILRDGKPLPYLAFVIESDY